MKSRSRQLRSDTHHKMRVEPPPGGVQLRTIVTTRARGECLAESARRRVRIGRILWPVLRIGDDNRPLPNQLSYSSSTHAAALAALGSGVGVLLTLLLVPPLIARIDAEENLLCAQFGDEYDACSHAWRLIPGLYYQIRTGKVALFDGSWIASAARKVGSGKYAKWLLFHLHQLPKFAQQNMH